jgi:hypothetical protein
LLALPLVAQEEKQAEGKPHATVQKLFVLKYADPQSVRNLLQVFHANIDANRDLRVLAVDATPETMAAIEDAIKRLDVPSAAPVNVDLSVYLVVGHEGESATGSGAIPRELDPVVTQLKNAFTFKSYSLLDTLALRTRTGQQVTTKSSGGAVTYGNNNTAPVIASLRIATIGIDSDGTTVHINNLAANIMWPESNGPNINTPPFNYRDLGLTTDIDIKEGQKVVVGRLGVTKDQALFLVMTAKVLP